MFIYLKYFLVKNTQNDDALFIKLEGVKFISAISSNGWHSESQPGACKQITNDRTGGGIYHAQVLYSPVRRTNRVFII
jgi:hypothetical protein